MTPFLNFESRVVPLPVNNIDTDQIIPARFLKTTSKLGLDKQLFCDWRYDANGNPKPDFILNQPRAIGAEVLLAGDNFGCGSSREHAPWALTQFGFRAVISSSFADIFANNSTKNGFLTVKLTDDEVATVMKRAQQIDNYEITVDLEVREVRDDEGFRAKFPIDEFVRHCLLNGLDDIGLTLQYENEIAGFEKQHPAPSALRG